MSGALRIVAAGPQDAADIAALHALCFEAGWDEKAVGDILAMPGAFALVAEWPQADDVLYVGFVLARAAAGEAEILSIGVAPAARGAGLGLVLLEAAIVRAMAMGAQSLFLEVAGDNRPAVGLYEKRGFVRVGVRPGYYARKEGSAAALVMRLDLE